MFLRNSLNILKNHQFIRYFNTENHVLCKESRVMKKILSPTKKQRKHKYVETPTLSSSNIGLSFIKDGHKTINYRRISVLNKLFMENISDLMSTGSYSDTLTGHGIEIHRVRISPDFKLLKVYWLSNHENITGNIEEILKQHAFSLRHELSQLKVMGVVPRIQFVKDFQSAFLNVLDTKLKQADYGEDHVPINPVSKLKSQIEMEMKLETHIKRQIDEVEQLHKEEIEFADLPPMPQNVLGLNHENIMNRVMKSLHKSKAFHRRLENTVETERSTYDLTVNESPIRYSSQKSQREALKVFLQQRTLLRANAQKVVKSERLEQDYMEELWEQEKEMKLQRLESQQFMENEDLDEFYEEEFNKYNK